MLPRFHAPFTPEAGAVVTLPEEEARHATRVLRLGAGESIAVFDGAGREWRARIVAASRSAVRVKLLEPMVPARESRVRLILLQAVLKGDHMDAVVRDATMAGAAAIVPVITSRTIPSSAAAAGRKAPERWKRVALASAKQCRRAVLPEIVPAAPLADALSGLGAQSAQLRLLLAEPATGMQARMPSSFAAPPSAALATGPEGGWSPDELALLAKSGFVAVTLGALTLRADAAALVAFSMLRALWQDL
ncbi:MAG TPA: 16S rRNA (uracil(1498)-N(3))-methyltransferase [Vicinamibacterales bacterium]|nr:16S rRNA (uracil(1498)-N(3))-methyltransferase [Vicinamibacterales bacterium]